MCYTKFDEQNYQRSEAAENARFVFCYDSSLNDIVVKVQHVIIFLLKAYIIVLPITITKMIACRNQIVKMIEQWIRCLQ